MEGKKWLLESDFPVIVSLDGVPVAAVFGRAGGSTRFYTRDNKQHTVRFSFPTGNGVDGTGALVQAQVLGRHGVASLTSSWTDDPDPEPIDPTRLPHTSFLIESGLMTAGSGPVTSLDQASSIFVLPDVDVVPTISELPEVLYVTGVSVSRELLTSFPSVGFYVYEWQLQQKSVVAGDFAFYLVVKGATPSYHVQLPHHKVPLRGIFQPWGVETPLAQTVQWHDSDPTNITVCVVAVSCAYIPAPANV